MSNDMTLFSGAGAIAAANLYADNSIANQLGAGLVGGINRISVKGSRFTLVQGGQVTGQHNQLTLDVVVLAAAPAVQRVYYKDKYDPSAEAQPKPSCWSDDGVVPTAPLEGRPANLQGTGGATACANCSMNAKGSSDTGGRACTFKKRVVVAFPDQLDGEAYAMDISSMSMFGESTPTTNQRSLKDYVAWLGSAKPGFPKGLPPNAIVTRLSFSNDSVPVLRFGVATDANGQAMFLNADQYRAAVAAATTNAVQHLLEMSAASEDSSAAPASAPVATPVAVSAPAPVVAPAPAAAPVAVTLENALQHAAVPQEVRDWAAHPAVTDDMVRAHLAEAYPESLEPPKPVAPPPPAPAPAAPAAPSAPKRTRKAAAPVEPAPVAPVAPVEPAPVAPAAPVAPVAPAATTTALPPGVGAALGTMLGGAFDDE